MQTININALAATRIILGKQGENQATKIAFRVAPFLAMWPNATVALAVQPPQGNAYPATVTLEDGVASWVISSADTAYAGDGKCELRILDGEVVKKSVTFPTRIIQSFTAAGEAPDIVKDWIEDAQEKLGEVETATEVANAAAESIDNMTVSAFGLAAGENPTVAVSNVDGHKHIAFGIPKGDAGDQDPHGGGLTSAVKAALLQLAQKVAYVDNGGQTYYTALYDALYAAELVSISASFSQGNTVVYASDSLNTLKSMLTVTATYSDSTTEAVMDYTLSGTLTEGTSTVTVTYGGKTATFNVSVTATPVTLSSISAIFTQGGNTIYTTDTLTSLKQYLTVTATYSDSTTAAVTDYTLSGTLTEGTSTITVTYGGKTATFTVTVSAPVTLSSISASFSQGNTTVYESDSLDTLKTMLTVTATYSDSTTRTVSDYTLSGTLTEGTSTVTVTYGGETATFTVTVTETPTLSSISASFDQGNNTIYDSASLNDLKQYLTVTATYSDSTTETVTDYTLSGTLSAGSSTITATYGGKTATFSVTVTAAPAAISSISASYNQGNNTVCTTDTLDSLKQYLTVTATYSDSTTATLSASDYTLSGTLEHGTRTITVSSGGKTATFTVYVCAALPSGYTELTYIATDGGQYIDPQITSGSVRHVEYEIMLTALNSDDTSLSSSDQGYMKGNHIFSGKNCYFPYLTGNSSGWRTTLYGNRFGQQSPYGENETNLFDWNLNQRYVLSGFANDEIKVDGVTKYHLGVGGSATGDTMLFFCYGYEPNKRKYRFRGKLYYAKFYDSTNALIHDYVPCKNSSNVAGLYDLVGEIFISSATSNALIAGEVAS